MQATRKQLWALYCIYKKDYRNSNLTVEEASELIGAAKGIKTHLPQEGAEKKIESLEQYLTSKESIKKLIDVLGAEFKIGSIIMNDTNFLPDDGKRYLLLGSGCGFSYINYDKRNKKIENIVNQADRLKEKVNAEVRKNIDESYLKKLENCGNSIQAHQFQNLRYKAAYNYLVISYMQKIGINTEKVYCKNFDD